MPFYQPLASLEFFDRAINRKDIATGKIDIQPGSTYKTVGPADNFVFHGNATVEFNRLPEGSVYDTATSKAKPNANSAKNLLLGGLKSPKKEENPLAPPNVLRRRSGSMRSSHDRT